MLNENKDQPKKNKNFSSTEAFSGPEQEEEKSSYIMGAMHIANTITGTGMLVLPLIMRYYGIVFGTFILILVAMITIYTVHLLLECNEMTGKKGYSSFSKIVIGRSGPMIVRILIIINNFGLCCAYFRIFGQTAKTIVQAYVEKNHYLVTNWHNYVYILILFGLTFLIIFRESLHSLKPATMIGIYSIVLFQLAILAIFGYKYCSSSLDTSFYLWAQVDVINMISTLPSVYLTFTFHYNLFPVFYSLKEQTRTEMMKSSIIGVVFCLILNLTLGICGVLMYGKLVTDTVLDAFFNDMITYRDNFGVKYLCLVANVTFLINSSMCIPLCFLSLKKNIFSCILLWKKREEQKEGQISLVDFLSNSQNHHQDLERRFYVKTTISKLAKIAIILLMNIIICSTAIIIPELKMIFNIVGSTSSNAIGFILPPLFYLKISSMRKVNNRRLMPIMVLVFGILSLIGCFTTEIIRGVQSISI